MTSSAAISLFILAVIVLNIDRISSGLLDLMDQFLTLAVMRVIVLLLIATVLLTCVHQYRAAESTRTASFAVTRPPR